MRLFSSCGLFSFKQVSQLSGNTVISNHLVSGFLDNKVNKLTDLPLHLKWLNGTHILDPPKTVLPGYTTQVLPLYTV